MEWEDAFAAVSRGPAEIFGVGSELGRLERNYVADVVVWDGDPLEVMSAPSAVFIGGVEQPLVSRQTRLRDRYHPSRQQ
jgi:imidazolonepropionase-like amidohydrolase